MQLFFFSFQDNFGYFRVFCGSEQILGLFFLFCEKCQGYFDRDCIKYVNFFQQYRHFINNALCLVAQSCPTHSDPKNSSPPGSSVHGTSQEEYQNGLPFPPPGDLPDPEIKPASPMSPALQEDSLPAEPSEIIIPIHLHKISFCLFISEYLFLVT